MRCALFWSNSIVQYSDGLCQQDMNAKQDSFERNDRIFNEIAINEWSIQRTVDILCFYNLLCWHFLTETQFMHTCSGACIGSNAFSIRVSEQQANRMQTCEAEQCKHQNVASLPGVNTINKHLSQIHRMSQSHFYSQKWVWKIGTARN